MTIRGSKARIGFLFPVDGLNDDEFWQYLPDGVSWLTARYTADQQDEDLTTGNLEAYADPDLFGRASLLLRAVKPHVIACGDNAGTFMRGARGERAIAEVVSRVSGVATSTMSAALVAALNVLGTRRVSIVSPYSAEVSQRLVTFLGELGIDAVRIDSADHQSEEEIGLSDPAHLLADGLGADDPAAEAIMLAGGGIRAAAIIDELEKRTGKPVVAGPQALVWHSCRLASVDATQTGLGRLFSQYGNAELGTMP